MKPNFSSPSKIKFRNFNDAANHILHMLSKQLKINTLFIAENDGQTNRIMKATNRREELVTEGYSAPLEQTFCSLTIRHGQEPLTIDNISKDKSAGNLEISNQFTNGSFIGIPVYYEDGTVYGTICGLDNQPFEFTEEHQTALEMMSSLLTYVLELEKAREEIQTLSSPLVPITDGISILPIIGNITVDRIQLLSDEVVTQCGDEIDYLVIDFSGVKQIDMQIERPLLDMIKVLKIMGITPVITGIKPFMAIKVPHLSHALKGEMMEGNLKSAIEQLGFMISMEKTQQK